MVTAQVEPEFVKFWPTPFLVRDIRDERDDVHSMNDELRSLILDAESRQQDPLLFGTIGATKTSLDILRWDEPAVAWLRARIMEAVDSMASTVGADSATDAKLDLIAEGWAVVYRSGASHRLHTHHDSAWSGVYYIATGGVGPAAGHLQVLDARAGAIARQRTDGVAYVTPQPGVLVCFPSWLPHSVKATLHDGGERICVAFNVGYDERVDS